MKEALKDLFTQKATWTAIIGLIVYFGAKLGLHLDPTSLWVIAGAFMTLLGGHALAMHGKDAANDNKLAAQAQLETTRINARMREAGFIRLGAILIVAGSLVLGLVISSCAWWQSSGKGMAKAGGKVGAVCAIGDLMKYAGQVEKALATESFKEALDEVAHQNDLKQDAMNCLVQSVLAVLSAQQPTTGQPTPIVLHARAYLAEQGL